MENKDSEFFHSPTWYFIVALISALLVLVASKIPILTYHRPYISLTINLRWIFWLALAISFISLAQLLRVLMHALYEQHRLPAFLAWLFEERFTSRFEHTVHRIRSILQNRVGRLTLAGIGIFVVTSLLWLTNAIHDDEVDVHAYRLIDAIKGRSPIQPAVSYVSLLHFITTDEGSYFGNRLRLIKDLKNAGVKAVLMNSEGRQFFPEDFRYMRELEKLNIVVFASEYGSYPHYADSLGVLRLTFGAVTLDQTRLQETIDLACLKPIGTGYANALYDVTTELIRKYSGYADDLSAHRIGSEVTFGQYKIPVSTDGWTYSRNLDKWFPSDGLVYVDSVGEWKYRGSGGIRVFSRDIKSAGLKLIPGSAEGTQDIGDQLRGKIVILEDSFTGYSYMYPRAYADALQNILDHKTVTKSGRGHLWISFVCLALAGLIAYRFRVMIAIPSIFILGLLTLLFCSFLYDSQNYLIDIFYPLLSVAIAMVTFPIIAMTSEA